MSLEATATVRRVGYGGGCKQRLLRLQDPGEWAAEEEHEEDEEGPATEAGGSEGSNESVSADSHEELPVLQASDGEEDNERSVRRFGYNPDNGDVWGEYQPAVGDPMFACYLDLHGNTI